MSAIIDERVVAGAKSPNVVKEDPIVALIERVKSLYLYRDHYFENHSIERAIDKSEDIEREMRETLTKFDECKGYEIDGSRAKYYYLKGRAMNVVDHFVPQAEELLSKAVKLEPKLVEAWNELGECYWKNDDIKQAKTVSSELCRTHVDLFFHYRTRAFCIVVEEKTCMAVTVYNLAKGRGVTVGDSIAILELYLTHQTFSHGGDVPHSRISFRE